MSAYLRTAIVVLVSNGSCQLQIHFVKMDWKACSVSHGTTAPIWTIFVVKTLLATQYQGWWREGDKMSTFKVTIRELPYLPTNRPTPNFSKASYFQKVAVKILDHPVTTTMAFKSVNMFHIWPKFETL
jgi:hypothetical protein